MSITDEKFNIIASRLTVLLSIVAIFMIPTAGVIVYKTRNNNVEIEILHNKIELEKIKTEAKKSADSLSWTKAKIYLEKGFSMKYPVDLNHPYWYK